jgi:hypothetical protein
VNKITLLLLALFGLYQVGFSQDIYVEHEFVSSTGPADDLIELVNHIVNNSPDSVAFRWERIENNYPAGWIVSFCDKNNCYAPTSLTADFILAPGESGIFKPMFTPHEIEGMGILKVRVYALSSEVSFEDTVTYQATTSGYIGISSPVESAVEVYPSVTSSVVNVSCNNMNNVTCRILNSAGMVVVPLQLLLFYSGRAVVDLSGLNAGKYYIVLEADGSNPVAKSIIKL